jgi:hypothetical protein
MKKTVRQMFQEALDNKSSAIPNTDSDSHKMKHGVAPNFLRHVYSESVPDLAKITVAEAEGTEKFPGTQEKKKNLLQANKNSLYLQMNHCFGLSVNSE